MTELYLALDTATDVPSLALGTAEAPGGEVRIPSRRDLSREIEHVVGRLLAAHGADVGDLTGVVVADGPGSFTGLRIGIAFAKGLCRARSLPLLTASSLLGAARAAARGSGVALAEYDALRGDVYRAAYRFTPGSVEVLLPPALARAGSPISLPPGYACATAEHASAASLLRLAHLSGGPQALADPAAWEPTYGRPAEAEARYRARGGLRVGGADAQTTASVSGNDSSGARPRMAARPLLPADLDRVAAIERVAFTDPWSRRSFEELLDQPQVHGVAVDGDDGALAGYALFSIVAGEGEILNLAVDPAARRRGLASRLLDTVLDRMREARTTSVFLEVRQSNLAAIRLYAGVGFRSVSLRRAYYRNPTEHAVTMALELTSKAARKG